MEREQSEFNDSIGLLRRINIQLYFCWEARRQKNIALWIDSLNSLSLELCNYIKPDEMKAFNDFIRKNHDKIMIIANTAAKSSNYQIPFELFMELRDWEIKLRNVYNDSGLESKKKKDFLDDDEEW
jgi:hypothetical protein